MSAKQTWDEISTIAHLRTLLKKKEFANRVHLIRKLVNIINEALDGMEAEVARECP